MKSITNKFLGILSALCLCMGWSACTDEVEYTGAALQDATQAYFPTNLPSQIDLKAEATTFNVEVSRMEAGQELTVNLTKSDDKDALFTVPSTVTFAADATTATISIGYDPAKFKLDEYMPLTISIESDKANPYSSASYSFTVGVPAPYTTIGMVSFRDGYLDVFKGFTPQTYNVELQVNSVTPGLYRLVNPYKKNPYAVEGIYDSSKNYYLVIDATDKDCVYIPSGQPLGLQLSNDGMLVAYSYAGYMLDGGKSKEEVKEMGLFGKLENNIITFPMKSLLVLFTNDSEGNLYYANNNGAFALAVDTKTQIKDYSLEAECTKIGIDMSGNTSISGNVAWGDDISYVRLAVIEASKANEAIDGVLNGSIETVKQVKAGAFELPFNITGKLAVLAVGFDELNEIQAATIAEFTYNTGDPYADLLPDKSIDDYVGTWRVPAFEDGNLKGYMKVAMSKKDASTLVVNGLFSVGKDYDDSVELAYDAETGFIEMSAADLPAFEHSQVGPVDPVFLAFAAGSDVSDTDALIGGLTEGGTLQFINKVGNSMESEYFAIFGFTQEGKLYSFSYDFGFEWQAATQKNARVSNDLSFAYFCKSNLQMVKKSLELRAPVAFTLSSVCK